MERSVSMCTRAPLHHKAYAQAFILACQLLLLQSGRASEPDLVQPDGMRRCGPYQQTYEMVPPSQYERSHGADLTYLMDRAALEPGIAADAKRHLEASLASCPDSAAARLALGRALHAMGDHGEARIVFETALRFDSLPSDLLSQVNIYDEAARQALEGRRLVGFGYAEMGMGVYRVNSTRGTQVFGDEWHRNAFYNTRVGGGINYSLDEGHALDAMLDYRHRYYEASRTRDDSDLRWSIAGSNGFGENNLGVGLRGRVSYRGNGDYRNDVGLFADYTRRIGDSNQFTLGAEVQRRRYPRGALRERSRTNSTVTVGWSRSMANGRATFSFSAHGGRNGATSRPDGNSSVIGSLANFDYAFSERLDGFVYVWWERDAFNTDRVRFHPDSLDEGVVLRRKDNLYEGGFGLTWEFAAEWSLRPELVYVRDQSNLADFNYSSTEMWINVRKGF